MWQTTSSCTQCEKLSIFVQSTVPIQNLQELPSTYERRQEKYVWKFHEFMAYTLVPRMIDGTRGVLDLYLCIDEEDFDDIDVDGYANRFLKERIFPLWKNLSIVYISEPMLSTAQGVRCRKLRHRVEEETR